MAAIVCRNISDLCQNPFCLVVTAASLINIGPIVVGLQSLGTSFSCKGSSYCTISMLFAVTHIAASLYVASMISNRNSRRLAGQNTATSRFTWLLCNDTWVAAYIIVLLVFFAWLWVGIPWRIDNEVYDGTYCPHHVGSWVNTCIGCGFSYFTALFWSLIASFCVACCCDGKDYSPTYTYPNIVEQQQQHGSAATYVQYHSSQSKNQQTSPGSRYGATGNGGAAAAAAASVAPSAPPLVPVPVPASAPSYDPEIPTAVATPVVDGKPS
mmetsp:Transcript_15713/g.34161  ORF Transcript_15713/g.34161 Transcript_15713/m.34161 type:complete len:268 (+) Transcript_15713:85-888(+)